jgi:3-hydroxyacyl-CoA dehydrogenase
MMALQTSILKAVGIAIAALLALGYINVLRSDRDSLQASVELQKAYAEQATISASNNLQKYLELQELNKKQSESLLALQKSIDKIKEEQHSSEKEIIEYVEQLPEGFERACLNMPVSSAISGLSNN